MIIFDIKLIKSYTINKYMRLPLQISRANTVWGGSTVQEAGDVLLGACTRTFGRTDPLLRAKKKNGRERRIDDHGSRQAGHSAHLLSLSLWCLAVRVLAKPHMW